MTYRETLNSIGLLTLRLSIGLFMLVAHGWTKLMGFSELAHTFPDPLGLGSRLSLVAAIAAEAGCSTLLILGLGSRIAAMPLAFTMIIALFVIHEADPWQKKELAAVYLAVYTTLLCTGGGRFSLDHLIWTRRRVPASLQDSN